MAVAGFEPTSLDYEPNKLPDYSIPQGARALARGSPFEALIVQLTLSKKGFEPLHINALQPKCNVSTNSTTLMFYLLLDLNQ